MHEFRWGRAIRNGTTGDGDGGSSERSDATMDEPDTRLATRSMERKIEARRPSGVSGAAQSTVPRPFTEESMISAVSPPLSDRSLNSVRTVALGPHMSEGGDPETG